MSASALILAVTATATGAPGGARGGQAFLEPLIPIITERATVVVLRSELAGGAWEPIVPVVRDDGAEAYRTSEMDDWQAPPKPSYAIPPPVIVRRERPPVPPREAWSLGMRFEFGLFSPDAVNETLAERMLVERNAITSAVGASVEHRPLRTLGFALQGTYHFTPPISLGDETFYLHGLSGSGAIRFYVPATDSLWFATGPEIGVVWVEWESHAGVAPAFTWRFAFQFRDPDLPIAEVASYFRRAVVDDDGFEIELSSIGVMADFHFDL